jgi:hypothetical protein
MPEKGEELYKILKADPNYEGVGSDYNKFKTFFSDEKNYTNLYNTLKADPNYEGIGKDANSFSEYFGLKKKEPTIPPLGQAFKLGGESTPQLPLTSQSRLGEKPKAVNDFNTKYGTNYTLKQLAGKEPILPQDETSFVMEKIESVKRGSERLGQMIANTPSFLYDIAAYPQNKIAELTGLNIGTSAKEFAQNYNLPENEVANYYKKAADESQSKIAAKYDKGVTEYFFGANPDYKKGFGLLTNQIAESLPITLSLMVGNAAGLSATASTFGGGVVFGAGKKDELEQANPNMPQSVQLENALGNGLMEGLFEQYGLSKLGSLGAKLIKEKGKDEATKIITEGFKETYLPILKKYLGIGAEESAGEAATQFAQNVIDKYSGEKPDLNLADGVADAAMVGIGSSVAFSTPTATAEMLSVSKDRKKAKEILGKKIKVEEQIANPNTTPEAKQALVEVAKDLTSESANIFDKAKIELQNIPEEEMFQLKEMSAKIEQLDNASQDATLDPELKRDLEIKYEEANKQLDEKIDELNKRYIETQAPQEITTEPTSTEGVEANVVEQTPALRDVESTAKALEGLDKESINNLEKLSNIYYHGNYGESIIDGKKNKYGLISKLKDFGNGIHLGTRKQAEEFLNQNKGFLYKVKLSAKDIKKGFDEEASNLFSEQQIDELYNKYLKKGFSENESYNKAITDLATPFKYKNQIGKSEALKYINTKEGGGKDYSIVTFNPDFTKIVSAITIDEKGESIIFDNSIKDISESYHAAKTDGSNPELVEAVESLLSKEQTPASDVEAISIEEQQAIDEAIPNLAEPLKKEIKGLTTIENLMSEGVLEYVDEQTGEPCMKHGIKGNSFKRGSKWEIVKDLKGYKTHEQGGVDLTIGSDGIKIKNGKTDYYAKNGLLMPNN